VRINPVGRDGRPTLAITMLLASLSMISPLSIDTFLPSFPAIAAEFDLTSWEVQQIITAYLLPFACFSLVHGPLSDALGRRRVVIGGLVVYTAGSIGCLMAPSFAWLLVFRVMQGMAAGLGPTVARAVVRDVFEGANAQRLMSSMMLLFAVAPAVAPILGGWLHVVAGWRSVFGLLSILGGALMVITFLLLPETHPAAQRARFHPGHLARDCWRVATQPAYFLYSMASATAFAALFIHFGSAPAIILDTWKLSETQFHYVFLPIVAGLMAASILANRIAGRVGRRVQLQAGFSVQIVAAAVAALAQTLLPQVPIWLTQTLWFFTAAGAQTIFPILSLQMLDMNPTRRGAAASVQTFISLGIGAFVMGVIAPAMHGNLVWLAYFSLGGSLAAIVCWRAGAALQRR
jgi:MFS transporter, DHA1 family, multidrug resistance protein